jgi:hypothetical protein
VRFWVCTNSFIVVSALLSSPGFGQEGKKEQPTPAVIPTPSSAVGWALSDLATLSSSDRPFQRYLWIPHFGDKRWQAAISFTVNTAISHSTVIQHPAICANGWLVRWDLRRLAPSVNQLKRLIEVWDGLAVQDPYFHVSATTIGADPKKLPAAILAPHLKQPEAVALAGLSLSTGAIYRSDWFIAKALTTLNNGAYYDFLQIQRVVEKNRTVQGVFLASQGIFEAQTKELSADQRVGILRSNVTGKPRQVILLFGLNRGGNLGAITKDIFDEDVTVERNPIRNLLEFSERAREVIVERPNGMLSYTLFNDKGELQNSVPENVAANHLAPAPFTKRLEGALHCIICHSSGDGWQPLQNDVQTLLSSKLDIFTDLADANNTREQIIDKLAGHYSTNVDLPDESLGRARRDYKSAVYKIVGDAYPDTESPVVAVSNHISEIYSNYHYTAVNAKQAALELGLNGLDELPIELNGAIDPMEGALRAGLSINRSDWEHIYPDVALKANLARNKKEAN